MIQKGLIQVRPLPLIYRTNHWDALYAYMVYLHHLGLLHMENGYIQKKANREKVSTNGRYFRSRSENISSCILLPEKSVENHGAKKGKRVE